MNKITKEFLESQIDDIKYTQMNDRLTHCLITTKSGFLFSGESVVVDLSNFDKELGEKYAYEEAFNKIEQGYIRGANANGDFLDRLTEYGPLLDKYGFDIDNCNFMYSNYKLNLENVNKENE